MSKPTLNDMARILNDCVVDFSQLVNNQNVLPMKTREVIHETVLAFPDYAAKWIAYAMEHIEWKNDREQIDRRWMAKLKQERAELKEEIDRLKQELAQLKGEQGA